MALTDRHYCEQLEAVLRASCKQVTCSGNASLKQALIQVSRESIMARAPCKVLPRKQHQASAKLSAEHTLRFAGLRNHPLSLVCCFFRHCHDVTVRKGDIS